jgi:hypothetical protein
MRTAFFASVPCSSCEMKRDSSACRRTNAKAAVPARSQFSDVPRLSSSHLIVRREPSRAAFLLERELKRVLYESAGLKELDMRAHRAISFAISICCGIAVQQKAAHSEEYRGTWEQQMACTPDVWRLCGAHVPDMNRIVACLRRNSPQLSGPCRAVFQQSARRGDEQPRYDQEYRPRRDRDYGPRPYGRDYGPRSYEDDE